MAKHEVSNAWYRWANFGRDPLSRNMHFAAHAFQYGEDFARSLYTKKRGQRS